MSQLSKSYKGSLWNQPRLVLPETAKRGQLLSRFFDFYDFDNPEFYVETVRHDFFRYTQYSVAKNRNLRYLVRLLFAKKPTSDRNFTKETTKFNQKTGL